MAYAIIRVGGHQEKVSPGEQITIDKVKQDVGAELTFTPLMVSKAEGDVVSDKAALESATVVAKVLQHVKADKVDVFQYRHKTGYRRHTGHRQPLTLVEIAEIRLGGETFTAPPPPERVEEPGPASASEAAEGTSKPKPAGKTKPAAKKPATKKAAAPKSSAKKK